MPGSQKETRAARGAAIIVGASSGIGRALTLEWARRGYQVGICGRREPLLAELVATAPDRIIAKRLDITKTDEARTGLLELIDALDGAVDVIVLNAGVGEVNPDLNETTDLAMIDTNARGFAVLAAAAYKYFCAQKCGHLVGITSVAAVRAGPGIAYNASKAFASRYLDGLRLKALAEKIPVSVTDVRPGFVDTAMIDREKAFWVASASVAARQIVDGLTRRPKVLYVTRRWRFVAMLMRLLPDRWYARMR